MACTIPLAANRSPSTILALGDEEDEEDASAEDGEDVVDPDRDTTILPARTLARMLLPSSVVSVASPAPARDGEECAPRTRWPPSRVSRVRRSANSSSRAPLKIGGGPGETEREREREIDEIKLNVQHATWNKKKLGMKCAKLPVGFCNYEIRTFCFLFPPPP